MAYSSIGLANKVGGGIFSMKAHPGLPLPGKGGALADKVVLGDTTTTNTYKRHNSLLRKKPSSAKPSFQAPRASIPAARPPSAPARRNSTSSAAIKGSALNFGKAPSAPRARQVQKRQSKPYKAPAPRARGGGASRRGGGGGGGGKGRSSSRKR